MSVPLLATAAPPACRHATREEYLAALRPHLSAVQCRHELRVHAAFLADYPDLRDWFAAPLTERVGLAHGTDAPTCSLHARPYLYFLAQRGDARFDWPWLLAVPQHVFEQRMRHPEVEQVTRTLAADAVALGFGPRRAAAQLGRAMKCLYLHLLWPAVGAIGAAELDELEQALRQLAAHPDRHRLWPTADGYRRMARDWSATLHLLRVVCYHRGQLAEPPVIARPRPAQPSPRPQMAETVMRYQQARRAQGSAATTVARIGCELARFIAWLTQEHPAVCSFAQVTREQVLAYAAALAQRTGPQTGRPLSLESRISCLSSLSVFFRDAAAWGWEDVPERPLLGARDLPKRPLHVPRYIPRAELVPLMEAIRGLRCPYQRAALLVARWSGGRCGEIRNLDLDCLDAYPDGTPRLRLPVGKTKQERIVPIHAEAAAAIRAVQALARPGRGFRDERTGVRSRRLFVQRGRQLSIAYLLRAPLEQACRAAGLVGPDGRPTITPHRFRHTVATQLAEGGAKLHTIMKILGHTSVEMTLVYAYLCDQEVLRDYQKVLGPGAVLAGPFAATLRAGELPPASVDWLKTNFLKTELELGHCLRLPQEGPCECDLALSCAKFVTTPAYAPRLRARRQQELVLIADAQARGWEREIERHRQVVRRLEQLLGELGESVEEVDRGGPG